MNKEFLSYFNLSDLPFTKEIPSEKLLIPIGFQDETNCAILASWQDHEESIRTW
ncbi:hypothetical protein ES708_13950 [subsurface metagenome]